MGCLYYKSYDIENEIRFTRKFSNKNYEHYNDISNLQKDKLPNQSNKEEIFNNNNNKNNESSNNSNFNENLDILNSSTKTKNEQIYICFIINETKELYLQVKISSTFNDVIKDLKEKYDWLQYYKEMIFNFKNQKIDKNKTINDLGIKENDIITITTD